MTCFEIGVALWLRARKARHCLLWIRSTRIRFEVTKNNNKQINSIIIYLILEVDAGHCLALV